MKRRPLSVQIQVPVSHAAVGGGVRHAYGLAAALRDAGVRVSLLRTGEPNPVRDRELDELITFQPRNLPLLWRWPPLGSLGSWIRVVREAVARVDAVIALGAVAACATRWTHPGKLVLFAPGYLDRLEYSETAHGAYRWFEKKAFQQADCVLVRTRAVREAIEAHYLRLRCPVGIALPGVDEGHATDVKRTRAELGIPPGARLLITLGLINENKGQRYIAAALARCAGPDWWWAVIGSGADESAVREALRGSAMERRTLLVGVDERVGDWYAAADLLVACSRVETFGQAIAEALWVGLPVVIPENEPGKTLSPLAEHVRRYRLGHTFCRSDVDSLAGVLREALSWPDELRQMGRRAAAFARTNFNWSNYAHCALRLLTGSGDLVYEARPPAAAAPDDVPAPESGEPALHGAEAKAHD